MTIKDELFTLLRSLTSPADQVYQTNVPDGVTVTGSYIVFQRIAAQDQEHLAGRTGNVRTRIQITAFAATPEAADALLELARAALTGWVAHDVVQLPDNPDQQDEATRLFAASSDFAIWHEV